MTQGSHVGARMSRKGRQAVLGLVGKRPKNKKQKLLRLVGGKIP